MFKFNKFLVDERGKDIIFYVTKNFIYSFSDTAGERHSSIRDKAVVNLSSGGSSKISDLNQGK